MDFLVLYMVNDGLFVKDFRVFKLVWNIKDEFEYLNLVWFDGDRVDIIVWVVDIFDKILDEIVIIYKDVILLVIENLWLMWGDRLNISVYSVEDFVEMM